MLEKLKAESRARSEQRELEKALRFEEGERRKHMLKEIFVQWELSEMADIIEV